MEIKLQLSEQEQRWLQEIAEHFEVSLDHALRLCLKEHYEQVVMEIAFDRFPQTAAAPQDEESSDIRRARKAALKESLMQKAILQKSEE